MYRENDPLLGHSISRLDRRITLRRSNSQAKQLGQKPELADSKRIGAVSKSALVCEGSPFRERQLVRAFPSISSRQGTVSSGIPVVQLQMPE